MESSDHIKTLADAAARMTEVLTNTPLDAPVPSCPDWVVRDLVQHLGGVHHWATAFVSSGRLDPIRDSLETQVGGWPPDTDLVTWFQLGAERLVEALSTAPEDLDCWTFLDAPTPLRHWGRRQAHETAIHRVDAELAAGVAPAQFDPMFAADGIDELLCAFITRSRRGPRAPTPRVLAIEATDTDQGWTVYFDQISSTTERSVQPSADTVVRAPAGNLYRWVWNRADHAAVDIAGSIEVADIWRSTAQVG